MEQFFFAESTVGNSDFDIIFLINADSIGSQKEREENMRFKGHFSCKKDLISSFDETRSFQFLLFKISHIEDKDFYLGRDKSNLREQNSLNYFLLLIAACAAESLAIGTRKGEQDT